MTCKCCFSNLLKHLFTSQKVYRNVSLAKQKLSNDASASQDTEAQNCDRLWDFSYILLLKRNPQKFSIQKLPILTKLTSRSVGLPLKNSVFLLLFGGLNLKFRKAHPLAIASKGAGPSYGNPRPTKSWKIENTNLNFVLHKNWKLRTNIN